jgi:hypothetical protein
MSLVWLWFKTGSLPSEPEIHLNRGLCCLSESRFSLPAAWSSVHLGSTLTIKPVVLNQGRFCFPEDTGQCWRHFLMVTTREVLVHWMRRGQGCCYAPCKTQGSTYSKEESEPNIHSTVVGKPLSQCQNSPSQIYHSLSVTPDSFPDKIG